jgi:hypothetical protein
MTHGRRNSCDCRAPTNSCDTKVARANSRLLRDFSSHLFLCIRPRTSVHCASPSMSVTWARFFVRFLLSRPSHNDEVHCVRNSKPVRASSASVYAGRSDNNGRFPCHAVRDLLYLFSGRCTGGWRVRGLIRLNEVPTESSQRRPPPPPPGKTKSLPVNGAQTSPPPAAGRRVRSAVGGLKGGVRACLVIMLSSILVYA